jgi:hypothetical protein
LKTEKKNQHYIPKFYLRNFSFEANQKQIGVFNITNQIFIQRAKLKTQGSKNFFYGEDGKIEDSLSIIEGKLATAIKKIIHSEKLPQKLSSEHFELMTFLTLTDFRNPVRIQSMTGMFDNMKKRLNELDPNFDTSKVLPDYTHEETVKQSLSFTREIIEITADLDYKLLINNTKTPFLTSDFPIIKYNQFLEQRKWHNSKSGYGVTGLQIFVPITPKHVILFFDSGIYKVGFKKRQTLELNNPKDIDEINVLNFINCFDTIFFNHEVNEQYVRTLFTRSKKFKRANMSQAELSYLIENDEDYNQMKNNGNKNLMIMNSSDCETKLDISGIKMHSKGKNHKLHPSMAQLRPHAEKVRKNSR